ncbi:MAG TPA: hypothetical protein VLY21_01985 [Nitrososphaerales archaeon]|nr:hypothetical protein [Nitrososphaerales archaeon]
MIDNEKDKHPARSLLVSVLVGCLIFIFFLFVVQMTLQYFAAGYGLDSSFEEFYPIMAALGALWGFSRWWSYEQGEYNPFHSK